jgi:hypothetical protein
MDVTVQYHAWYQWVVPPTILAVVPLNWVVV